MVITRQKIINDLIAHINSCGGTYAHWYVGIAENPRQRLFNDHNVSEVGDAWIFRETQDTNVARSIEDYFVDLGTDGGSGGGSLATRFIYAYKKTNKTAE